MNSENIIFKKGTLYVKFSNDRCIHRSFLDKWNIPYKEEDLEGGDWLIQKRDNHPKDPKKP